uniref:(northern house mosquito) hypothetical protein n=1 Tax=Culex pipiens TaxID=7175 RepID=A0A8D8GN70_CULPI
MNANGWWPNWPRTSPGRDPRWRAPTTGGFATSTPFRTSARSWPASSPNLRTPTTVSPSCKRSERRWLNCSTCGTVPTRSCSTNCSRFARPITTVPAWVAVTGPPRRWERPAVTTTVRGTMTCHRRRRRRLPAAGR